VLSLLQLPTHVPDEACKYKFYGHEVQVLVVPEQVKQEGLHISQIYVAVFKTVTPVGHAETQVVSY
jgi:hypothetical protein